jgi:hypothetical protein
MFIMDKVREVFGPRGIDFDPASCDEANAYVQAKAYYTKEQDGLTSDWLYWGNMFINPPGPVKGDPSTRGIVNRFWDKAQAEFMLHRDLHIIWMGFSLEQLATLQSSCMHSPLSYTTCILRKRVAFVGAGGCPTHSNYITLLSRSETLNKRFVEVFSSLGVSVTAIERDE